jgi:hypothetical protein
VRPTLSGLTWRCPLGLLGALIGVYDRDGRQTANELLGGRYFSRISLLGECSPQKRYISGAKPGLVEPKRPRLSGIIIRVSGVRVPPPASLKTLQTQQKQHISGSGWGLRFPQRFP